MIEVFKTNVTNPDQASRLIDQIHHACREYKANFDLEDCDRILRVKSSTGQIRASFLIDLLENAGFRAEVLPD
jgi:ketopantoate reductase